MKTKRVNARIKSKKELARRLMDGEVFYTPSGARVHYDEVEKEPFRVGRVPMVDSWRGYDRLLVEEEIFWQEDIPEQGVLCWVWDNGGKEGATISKITSYETGWGEDYPYKDHENGWQHARPLTNEEIEAFKR